MINRFTAVTAAAMFAASAAMAQGGGAGHPLTILAIAATAQSGKAPPKKEQAATLKVGDTAPALSVEEWVKGDQVTGFEKGKVYVVEFWATWCGPCKESIPHLTSLQKEYKDKGVTVIGVAASERGAGDKLATLKKFVKDQGDQMAYTVAYDEDRSMSRSWMEPAARTTIPTAFLIDKSGKLVWIGHPMNGLDKALKDAVAKPSKDKPRKSTAIDAEPRIILAQAAQPGADAKPAKKKAEKPAEPDISLFVGDTAPALAVSKWVKGDAVKGFDKEKTYVVEFWATWCGPCRISIPHLTQLQKDYKDKVTFIGVSVWESDQKNVEPFVKEAGDTMAYTVAMDDVPEGENRNEGKMARTWLAAAGQGGIPTAFIVTAGKVAWIGHPNDGHNTLEHTLDAILDGKYDLAGAAADYRKDKEVEIKVRPAQRKLAMAETNSDHDAAIEACDELLAISPQAMDQRNQAVAATKFVHLLAGKMDYDKAYAYGAEIVEGSMKDNAMALNEVAWTIVSPDGPKLERRDLKLALKAAQRAVDLTKNKDGMIMDTLAKVYHDQGNLTRALELQEKALKLIQGSSQFKGSPVEKEVSDRLDQYQTEAKNKGG